MGITRSKLLKVSLCQEFGSLQYFFLIGPILPEQKAIPIPGTSKNSELNNIGTINCILRAFDCGFLKDSISQI
jgi:hypothetical protein